MKRERKFFFFFLFFFFLTRLRFFLTLVFVCLFVCTLDKKNSL